MASLLDAIVNDRLVRDIALLARLNKSETGDDMFRLVTGARVMSQVCERLSGQSLIDEMREDTIRKICKYCSDHPNGNKEELTQFVGAEIIAFALKCEGTSA